MTRKETIIALSFENQDAANDHYLDLCERWGRVEWLGHPGLFTESGTYRWRVSNPIQ